jgi:hypothetical protein
MKFSKIELFILLNMLSVLAGCANSVSVTKLGLSGQYIPFVSTEIGGYSVGIQGNPTGIKIHYKDGDTIIDVNRPLSCEAASVIIPSEK